MQSSQILQQPNNVIQHHQVVAPDQASAAAAAEAVRKAAQVNDTKQAEPTHVQQRENRRPRTQSHPATTPVVKATEKTDPELSHLASAPGSGEKLDIVV
jgi:hypothetical protein